MGDAQPVFLHGLKRGQHTTNPTRKVSSFLLLYQSGLTTLSAFFPGWPFSKVLCKMSGFLQGLSVSASVFTLVAIAAER